ncbi:MAG: GTPase [Candidatus Aenigmatarchaeota archaeon]
MPVNPPQEYYAAEHRYNQARTTEEKILALEEMLRFMPRHHGSEKALAELRHRMSKLKKQVVAQAKAKRGSRKQGVQKEGDAQVCLIGFTNSGKSWLLAKLTDAKPEISDYSYTTKKPHVGMMDYHGIKIQLVELPATFAPNDMSVARTANAIVYVIRNNSEKIDLLKPMEDNYLKKTRSITVNPREETVELIKEKIWHMLRLILVLTKDKKPMSLQRGASVQDFAAKIHKDFIKDFRFAFVWREVNGKKIRIQAGLNYVLQDRDIVELHLR